MFKIIYFLWRRPDMTREEFVRYYEEKHTHNNARIRPASRDYRRNYPVLEDPWTDAAGLAALGGFDVMAENWYADRAGFAAVLAAITRSPGKELIAEDEARFEIRDRKKVFVAQELGTPPLVSADYQRRAARNEQGGFKLVRFVAKTRSLDSAQFCERYEAEVAPRVTEAFRDNIDYRRNYLLFDDPMSFTGSHDASAPANEQSFSCHLIEEMWYADRAAVGAGFAELEALYRCAAHEAIVDTDRSPTVVMAEHRTSRPEPFATGADGH
jgi:EthD domain